MKVTTASSIDIFKHNRMDAEFHIALNEVKDTLLPKVKAKYPTDAEAIEVLSKFDLKVTRPALALARGQKSLNRATMDAVFKEYPHLALAVILNDRKAIDEARLEAQETKQKSENLLNLMDELQTSIPASPKP